MKSNQRELIVRWFKKSKEMDDPFDKFIVLWISFNSFYACEHLRDSESRQLEIIKGKYKNIFEGVVRSNREAFRSFKDYVDTKPENTGFIQDLRYSVDKEEHKKRYYNLTSFCEYLKCAYQVRCNLFHGGKNLKDGQDKNIVKYSYTTLSRFLEKLYKIEEILI